MKQTILGAERVATHNENNSHSPSHYACLPESESLFWMVCLILSSRGFVLLFCFALTQEI